MAKTDNLTDFLTGVAGAIRTKKGTTALINPQDFESEIGSIDTAKPEQNKTLTVTENGTQTVKPDTGKVLSNVTVITNVPATPTEEKTVDLAMASGNQVVTPASGKHLTKVTITKPATLAAGNIKSGVNIGGVTGTLSPAKTEQAKTVDLAMASGNQVVSPDSGKVLSGVTITKPATLVASNIKKGVNIGGVTGTYEGESSGGKEVWMLDKNNPPLVNSGDGDYADQPFSVGSGLSQESYKIVVTSGEVKAVAVSGDHTKDYIIGNNNIAFNRFEYKLKDAYRKKMVFPKPVTGTLLQVLIKIAVKQPDNYAIQGYNNSAKSQKVTITSNGTTTITPDAPYDAMKNVSVTVNVAGTGSSGHKVSFHLETNSESDIYDAQGVDASALNFKSWGKSTGTYSASDINNVIFVSGYVTIDGTINGYCTRLPTFTGVTPTLVSGGFEIPAPLVYKLNGDCTISNWSFACLIKGTLITLADGSKKPVEDITYDDELLVWNFYKGCFDKAKPRWIKIAQTANVYNKLTFNNGVTLGLVGEGGTQGYHRIFNEQARLFTHTGVPETPVGTITFAEDCTKPTLVKQELVHEEVEFYNVITETHFNLFANGILTSCKNSNKYYIENMKYVTDKELMTDAEIEQDMLNREPIKLKKEIK